MSAALRAIAQARGRPGRPDLQTSPLCRYTMGMNDAGWTVVIPYYNEAAFLPDTLASLTAQTLRPFRVVLIDNGSTDDGRMLARAWAARQEGISAQLLDEPMPGQVHALARGIAAVQTPYLAICDADTRYPAEYLARADALMRAAPDDVVGYIGHNSRGLPGSLAERTKRWLYSHVVPHVLRNQAHGGGYAHLMRTDLFRASGGYSAALWPYVLKDHELAHRLMKQGQIRYSTRLWVEPSTRREDRGGVRWTLRERVLYHATPASAKDWFWYSFMRPRFEARGQKDTVLRAQPWAADQVNSA